MDQQLLFSVLHRAVSPLAIDDVKSREILVYLISRHSQALLQLETSLQSDMPPKIFVDVKEELPQDKAIMNQEAIDERLSKNKPRRA